VNVAVIFTVNKERGYMRVQRKEEFIEALAEYLTKDLAKRSIYLEMGQSDAKDWAKLYRLSGCSGWATKEEAIVLLKELL
jgi:hypothetical protein